MKTRPFETRALPLSPTRSTGCSNRSPNMPYRRSDFHQHITEVWGEYKAARVAVDRLRAALHATPDLRKRDAARDYLHNAHLNLEGTYIVRLFAAFEAALRSYDRSKHGDPARRTDASVMIDEIGGKRPGDSDGRPPGPTRCAESVTSGPTSRTSTPGRCRSTSPAPPSRSS